MYLLIAFTILYSYAPWNGSSMWDCVYLIYFYVFGVCTVPGAEQGFDKCTANEGMHVYDCGLVGQGHKANLENC